MPVLLVRVRAALVAGVGQLPLQREREDLADRSQHDGVAGTAFRSSREEEQSALLARWRSKFAELAAALEEAVAAHEQQLALEEQRRKEEEARTREVAAREAAEAAERASRHTELAEDARRLAELAKLRVATIASVRSLALVSAEHIAPALGYACPVAGGNRLDVTSCRTRLSLVRRRISPRGSLGAQGGVLESAPGSLVMLVVGTDNWARLGRCLGAATDRVGPICSGSAEPSLEEVSMHTRGTRRNRPQRRFCMSPADPDTSRRQIIDPAPQNCHRDTPRRLSALPRQTVALESYRPLSFTPHTLARPPTGARRGG